MRLRAIGEYFDRLFKGDAIALGITAVFAALVAVVVLVALRSRGEEKRWREQQRKKRGY